MTVIAMSHGEPAGDSRPLYDKHVNACKKPDSRLSITS